MSDLLKTGQHPDADQLSAFSEQSLPLHEQQQTLAHLAICADCRAVVYLAEDAAQEDRNELRPLAPRRPWFLSWNLAWPAAAAFAGATLLAVHLRTIRTATRPVAPVTTAHVQPPSLPIPAASTPSPAPSRPAAFDSPPIVATRPAHVITEDRRAPIPAHAPVAVTGAAENELYSQLPLSMNGGPRVSGALQYRMPGVKDSPAPAQGTGADNGNSGIYGGTGRTDLNENYLEGVPVAKASQQSASNPISTPVAAAPSSGAGDAQAGGAAHATTTLHSLNPQYHGMAQAAPPPPAPPPSIAGPALTQSGSNASSTVFAASDTSQMQLSSTNTQPGRLLLPSHLPAVSRISNPRAELAVDAAGSLFRSEDAGVTWTLIPTQWTGRAVRVSLASSPRGSFAARKVAPAATAPATGEDKATAVLQSSAFELTTDTGDHWISLDGQAWKRK